MATITVTPIRTFTSGETVTPTKLNELSQPTVALTAGTIVAADIADSSSTTTGVTNTKLRQSAALSVIGNSTNTTAAPADIAAGTDGHVLRRNGTAVGFGTVATAGIADAAITGPKLANGMVVQVVHASTNATTDITANIPSDNTIPQNTEGTEILTATITPASATNKILVSVVVNGTTASAVTYNVAVFKDSTANAIAAARNYGEGYTYQNAVSYYDSPATTSAITYKVRCGANSGTFYLNQNNIDVGLFGGACHSTLTLTEIKAS